MAHIQTTMTIILKCHRIEYVKKKNTTKTKLYSDQWTLKMLTIHLTKSLHILIVCTENSTMGQICTTIRNHETDRRITERIQV